MKNILELGKTIEQYSFLFTIDKFEKMDDFLINLASHLKKLDFEYDIFFEHFRIQQMKSKEITGTLILNRQIITESIRMDIKIYSKYTNSFYLDVVNLIFLEIKELLEYWTITEELKSLEFKNNHSKLIKEEIFKLEVEKEIVRAYRYNKIFAFIIIEYKGDKFLQISRAIKERIKSYDLIGKFLKNKIGIIVFDLTKSEEKVFFKKLLTDINISNIKESIKINASYFPYDGISFEKLLNAALKNKIKIN